MKTTQRSIVRTIVEQRRRARAAAGRSSGSAGFTLIELLISVGIMSLIMGGTMLALAQAARANETALLVTSMNNGLRTGMDMMIRDMLQVGSGLPPGHSVQIPCCTTRINLPGPPGTTKQTALGETEIYAIMQGTKARTAGQPERDDHVHGRIGRLRQDRHAVDAGRRQYLPGRAAEGARVERHLD